MNPIVFWYKNNKPFCFLGIFLILASIVYSYFTTFTKEVTIKEKDSIRSGKYGQNIITDTDGNIYSISNSLYHNFFTSAELFTKLSVGQTYRVSGFGYRIPVLGFYPKIITATKV